MQDRLFLPLDGQYAQYLRDESRTTGTAETISFPRTEQQVRRVLLGTQGPVTVQGARTGLAAAAVPQGGHILNLSQMDRVTALREENGRFFVTVQPGVVLMRLRRMLHTREFDTRGWDERSLAALRLLKAAGEQFFPTDPTETTATLGGMAACNASGARSFRYGAMRRHVTALRAVLPDGRVLSLRRGQCMAQGLSLRLVCEDGSEVCVSLPDYRMPRAKNASGYFIAPDMDALDLLIGSDGTLAVITELTLALLPQPPVLWGALLFVPDEHSAVRLSESIRREVSCTAALEYFDRGALRILSRSRAQGGVFAGLPDPQALGSTAVYAELHCREALQAQEALLRLGELQRAAGGDSARSLVARTETDRETLTFFRHAVPECVNSLIDERRARFPSLSKRGSDMSVPDGALSEMMDIYLRTLREQGFEYAVWGHIGDNHLHVNILPRDMQEHARASQLFAQWAHEVTRLGGAVSAEHGVGKLKAPFLEIMVGRGTLRGMLRVKQAFDPHLRLGCGNLFGNAKELL